MSAQEFELSQEEKAIDLYSLPEGWKWVTVSDAGANQKNAIVDGPFGSNLKVSDYVEGGPVPVLTTKNLEGNYDEVRYISQEKFEELKRSAVYPGDILMAKIGSCGKTGIYPANKPPAIIPANLLKMTLNEKFELKYVYHYFNSLFFQRALRTIIKATAQPAFGVTNFRKLPLPYVDRFQQKLIVAEIEKQFSRLDEAVANLKRVKANLKRYKAAVLKAAVEGRLVETEAELARREGRTYETGEQLLQRILDVRRSQWNGKGKYKELATPDTTDLPRLPEGWVWSNFESVAARVTVGHVGSMKDEYVGQGIPFLRSQNVRANRYDQEGLKYVSRDFHHRLGKSTLRPGDIVVVRSGSVGVSCVIPDHLMEANCSDLVIIKDPVGVLPHYGAYYMNSVVETRVAAGKVGIALTHFNTQSVAELPLPVPPMAEQHRIAAEVDRRFSFVLEIESLVDTNLQRSDRLRQSTLAHAFEGQMKNAGV
jgi:type I restriction enzyme, S subunit